MYKNVVLNLGERTKFNHDDKIPNSFRMLLIGSSGSGKTTLLLRMLIESDFLDYNNLIIFTSTKDQEEYQLLFHGFTNGLTKESIGAIILNQNTFKGIAIDQICKNFARLNPQQSNIKVTLSSQLNDITHPDKLDKTKKNLIIFDDCVNNANQRVMSEYFSRGRHASCNCIYLSQNFFKLESSIRLNSNFLILFQLSERNRNDVYNSVVGTMMAKVVFTQYAENVWSKKYSYIVIDRKERKIYNNLFDDEVDF